MQKKRNANFMYFLFWICLFLIISLLVYIITDFFSINTMVMSETASVEEVQEGNTQAMDDEAMINEEGLDKSIATERNTTDARMAFVGNESKIFTDGEIVTTGQFANERGTIFAAGIIYFLGMYPQDFIEMDSVSQSNNLNDLAASKSDIALELSIAFGWRNLPNFAEIEADNKNNDTTKIALPPIDLLDMKIEVLDGNISETQKKLLQEKIYSHVSELFQKRIVPKNITKFAMQRLASAYIQKTYESVDLEPNQ